MNKLWLIIKREYLVRVKKKSFILVTILTPLALAAIIAIPTIIMINSGEARTNIAVKDNSGLITQFPPTQDEIQFDLVQLPLENLKAEYKKLGYDGVLYLPKYDNLDERLSVHYYSDGQLSLSTQSAVERRISGMVRDYKIQNSGYDKAVLDKLDARISLEQREITVNEAGQIQEINKKNSAAIATSLGYLAGFFIYFVLIFYGAMVMRSVMEEKMSRIVEVIITSVKPFQLMLGKILGVSAVALTQLLIWIILIPTLFITMQLIFGIDPSRSPAMDGEQVAQSASQIEEILFSVQQQNWALIIPLFIFYFLGGYFIYTSMFAAVGASVGDDLGESQSLTFPIMLPIILAFIFMTSVIDNPHSNLAFWTSIIPLFSPVIMPARIPFGPPLWEIILSVVLLLVTAVFFVWLSGRIYRVGILLYGKKASLKELGKWLFYKE